METKIVVQGAKEHNLKDIDVEIPRDKMVVFTGVSGSGKSSLAFDTLYAEGQRRYVESLSAYARQFLGQMEKPKADYIGGLSPAIAIEQKAVSKNPRSTVGTVTEVYDYLRVLFARVGTPHCYNCGREVKPQSSQQIIEQVAKLPAGTRFQLMAPVAKKRKGTFEEVLAQAKADGFVRARIDGVISDLAERTKLAKNKKHDIELIVDRLVIPTEDEPEFYSRLADSVETALRWGEGMIMVDVVDGEEIIMSEKNACAHCGISFPELNPQIFSFNSPLGMCPKCNGLGVRHEFDPELFYNPELSINRGAVLPWGDILKKKEGWASQISAQIAQRFNISLDTPWKELPQDVRDLILNGNRNIKFKYQSANFTGNWPYEGVINSTKRRYKETSSENMRDYYSRYLSQQPCYDCNGQRLRKEALAVTLGGLKIPQIMSFSVAEAYDWLATLYGQDDHGQTDDGASNGHAPHMVAEAPVAYNLVPTSPPETVSLTDLPANTSEELRTSEETIRLSDKQLEIASELLKEIRERLKFMLDVGLHYLTLDRSAPSLSGGEGQRIRLASQIGSGLVGVMYVLDEPSIGLHQRDNRRLLDSLLRLRDLGNTVLVVEHDSDTMEAADWIVDFGPGAGTRGGEVVFTGTPAELKTYSGSITGEYLSGQRKVTSPEGRRDTNGRWLALKGVTHHNLNKVQAKFPLGCFTCVTGVSGSGKSSLVTETLYPALARQLHKSKARPGKFKSLEGIEEIDKVIHITQDPIGRTPRSNPATYVKVWDDVRKLFAETTEAKLRGYKPGRFSFNVKGGRCEACSGHGQKLVEMHFLPDVWVTCDVCHATRFNRETLQIQYKGKNIYEVLNMEVGEALGFFENIPRIKRILTTLHDVGLDYIRLGQSATTLSGGEAQRVKLAKELSRVSTGDTTYILDEPTTGLHFADIQRLLDVLHRLTDAGNTVIVIEHNLDVIASADWLIDLGPDGGDGGGKIIAKGTPEKVAQVTESYTGQFLRHMFETRREA
ncbi:excinuclease ABC subunit UvrA [Anaerolineales bacterium HSG25]|nr:excinuclease ABC subunit UvrA [Anaerolineales bacterium HSG25]